MDLWVIFVTGLTTGGLTCLAIQGGLLATTLTSSVVIPQPTSNKPKRRKNTGAQTLTGLKLSQNLWPVVYFLAAKLFIHTGLGVLLGALGAVFQITPTAQAVMQIFVGLFMLATALNMFNVHPIFRYFVIQPPRFLTRLVRDHSKRQAVFAPAVLGLMTVFIPCGTTQAMEILAVSSGSPMLGGLIMFVFVLGTSPTFLVLGFLLTRLRGKMQPIFATMTALLILLLGVLSLNAGLNLLGSPLAPERIIGSLLQPYGAPVLAQDVAGVQVMTINAYPTSYSPGNLIAKGGQPLQIKLVTSNSFGCTRAFTIPSLGILEVLPETGETLINLPPQKPGNIYFTCGMGMYSGVITIT